VSSVAEKSASPYLQISQASRLCRYFQVKPGRKTRTALPWAASNGRSEAAGEATDLIAFAIAVVFILHFQPKNHMSSPKST
jgi:hypothetical protein